jgi:CubicO group peptidase (beta-lactamase class C family)
MLSEYISYKFETSAPEEAGISSDSIAEFEQRLHERGLGLQGYMFYRNGKLAASSMAAPYRPCDKRHVYSVSKSFISTAVGIACDEGLLSVEDDVISFFPDILPDQISENLAAMKVKHLLSMNTGHQTDTLGRIITGDIHWAKRFLSLPVENRPGSLFVYNSGASYMLSAIITKVTGMRAVDYLRPRLFNPLGIQDVWWEESPEKISYGGWGIHVSPEDMLKLGVLYLNKGLWQGRRIISEEWVDAASSFVSDNSERKDPDWKVGYGYQFWRCRYNSFRADGAFSQFIVISPEKQAVSVIISETGSYQDVINVYWDTVYASMSDKVMPAKECKNEIKPFQELPERSCKTIEHFGFKLPANQFGINSISIDSAGDDLILRLGGVSERSVELVCGAGKWEYNKIPHCPLIPAAFLAELAVGVYAEIAAAWGTNDGNLRIAMQFVTTPHGLVFDVELNSRTLKISRTLDRGANPTVLSIAENL